MPQQARKDSGTKASCQVYKTKSGDDLSTDANDFLEFADKDGELFTRIDIAPGIRPGIFLQDDGTGVGYEVYECLDDGTPLNSAESSGTTGGNDAPERVFADLLSSSKLAIKITSNEANLDYGEVVCK